MHCRWGQHTALRPINSGPIAVHPGQAAKLRSAEVPPQKPAAAQGVRDTRTHEVVCVIQMGQHEHGHAVPHRHLGMCSGIWVRTISKDRIGHWVDGVGLRTFCGG